MNGGFPFAHRTVEQVVRDGDMAWPAVQAEPARVQIVTLGFVPAGRAPAHQFIPAHGKPSITEVQRDHG